MTQTVLLRRLSASAILTSIAVFCLPMAGSAAQEPLPINGSVYVAGKDPLFPAPDAPKNTHAYLTIRGQGAVHIYRAMTASAENDACRGGGWKIKRAGHFACSISSNGKKAECDFAVELQHGALDPGNPC